ncbi:MAG TPA: DUF5050 domain-containing protein [Polyangiaceae bacterium]|nr:DUF5050 domain-containing protein [Polyangiaceae bacterium]
MNSILLRFVRRPARTLRARSEFHFVTLVAGSLFGGALLVACGSSAPSHQSTTSADGTGGGDGGVPSTSPGGAGGESPASTSCNAPAPVLRVSATALASHLVAAKEDLYFIDMPPMTTSTQIRHVGGDGQDDGAIYASPEGSTLLSVWAAADTMYFVESTPQGEAALYRVPYAGGDKTKLSKDYSSGSAEIGGADANYVYVAVSQDGNYELRRVAADGSGETVIASLPGLAFRDMQIFGSDMWFLANDGLDGYYKVPLSGGAAPMQISPEPCQFEASVTSAGVYCSDALSLTRMPLTGGDYTKVMDLPDGGVDVSPPDGDFVYLTPKSTPDHPGVLRKFPVAGGTTKDLACGRGTMTIPVFNDGGIYWLEADATDSSKMNLYAAAK